MRIIKSFKMFESGLPYKDYEPIKLRIKEILDGHYYPNATYEKDGKKLKKQYLVFITPNESKFGTMIEVVLRFGDYWEHEDDWGEEVVTGGTNLKYSELNPEFKQATITDEFKDAISEFLNGNIDFVGFEFFEKSAKGQKNGHTKTIEDVTDKFNQALDELEQEPDELKDGTIKFTFNIK
jgi:hypothetical protein